MEFQIKMDFHISYGKSYIIWKSGRNGCADRVSSAWTRSFPTAMRLSTPKVIVRRDSTGVYLRNVKAVDVCDMTRMAAKGGSGEEQRCDSAARLDLNRGYQLRELIGSKLAAQGCVASS